MKKLKVHKLKLTILAVLIATLGIFTFTNTNAASSAPQSFTADSEKLLDGYIAGWNYAKLTSSLGGYVYCQDFNKQIPYGVTMTLDGEAPAGIAYILSNGFPRTSITGDDDKDYYITQAAIWWYEDLYMGGNNLSDVFKTTGSDPYNLRPHIKKLVEGAGKVTSYATPDIKIVNNDSSLNLSSDKKYYESNAISVNTLYVTGNYTVSLSNVPTGTVVVNANTNATQTSFGQKESFKIRIPVDNVDEGSLNITVKVTATGSINKAYKYKSSDPTKQSVYGSLLYPETSPVTDSTNLTLETSKVTITKIDADTNKALAGAKFVVKDSNGKKVASWTSTTSSHVIKNLPNGTYTLQETDAPEGYILNDQVVEFTISDTNRNIAIRFKNKAIERKATIIKVDADTNESLAGATFVIKDSSGKTVETFTTTTEAHVLENLANGTYTIEETKAPAGYIKLDKAYSFAISDSNNNVKLTIKNKAIEKSATIIKVDKDTGKAVAGAVLVVKDSSGKVIERFTTTEESHALKNLADGDYTVEEEKAPSGYKKTDEIFKFTISDTNNHATITIENEAIEKSATIIKVDKATGKPVAGAVLVVKDANGKVIERFTTTEESHVLKDLADGEYTVEEEKAPSGYKKTDEIFRFTISDTNNHATIKIENEAIEKTAEIIKIDSITKDPVAGAVLVVKNSEGEVVETFTTTTKSHILKDLADGTYTVEEIEAPKGYEKTDEIFEFTISDTNNKAEITIENTPIEKLVNILKVDAESGNPLSGATLVVKDSTGKVIEQFVTTTEPHTITGLADGEYTVEEIEAPEGYKKSDDIYKFTISDETPTALVIFENNEIVEVPFTGSNKSLISTLFGSILLISGVGFVYYNGKKQKVK